ncbi:hypothetical protein Tco_0523801 [Tanacetum coccineum]
MRDPDLEARSSNGRLPRHHLDDSNDCFLLLTSYLVPAINNHSFAAATWHAVIGQPPVTCHWSHRRTPVNHRWTTGQPSPDHRSTTSQWWRSTGQRVPRGSATSAGGDQLSDVSSDVAPCGDNVEIAKKAMAGFETMTSRS